MFWPCETRTSICRNLATISSGLYRFLAIAVLLDVTDIPQVGPLQWGRITGVLPRVPGAHDGCDHADDRHYSSNERDEFCEGHRLAPTLSSAASARRGARVRRFPAGPRYFGGSFLPFNTLPPPRTILGPPLPPIISNCR